MTITLYTNNSEDNRVTKDLTQLTTPPLTGTLREASSVLHPSVLIAGEAPAATCNYMYIAEFGRYYFVTDIVTVRNGLYMISGRVDVLMTYDAQIRAHKAIVKRQENDWNLYLDDGAFKVYSDPDTQVLNFPAGFSPTPTYVLMVV